jgi:hypothetical protein
MWTPHSSSLKINVVFHMEFMRFKKAKHNKKQQETKQTRENKNP